jgi:NADPH2 dehydrogenase
LSLLNKPIQIGGTQLKNRIVMAPMQQRMGTHEAFAIDHHIHHYGERAKGGVGLVIIESTSISENGRLFQDDIGIFLDQHIAPLKQIVSSIHENNTKAFIQLCHGGRKASPENKGKMLAPSSLAFNEEYGNPNELTIEEIQKIKEQFVTAARRSVEAGFDGIELHVAHGYLLHQFLSPLSNQRTDEYGGSFENRMKFVKEVLITVRKEVGNDYPVIIRVSASDYHKEGLTPEIVGEVVKLLEPLGLDAVHVSSGGLLPIGPSEVYPGYQVPYAETIKKFASVPVIAVGLIHTKEMAEDILESEKADCIAIGRPLLEDPYYVKDWISNN